MMIFGSFILHQCGEQKKFQDDQDFFAAACHQPNLHTFQPLRPKERETGKEGGREGGREGERERERDREN
jgi:hypothetical protein